MSKTILKDFKSFLQDLNEEKDDWEHTRADEYVDASFGHKGKNPPPALVKRHKNGEHKVNLSYWPDDSEDNKPYSVEHNMGMETFPKLSHALDYMRKIGHPVADHHVRKFKERALAHASRKND